jgi:pimeloyl-ACP methyl ester carboxylesterase
MAGSNSTTGRGTNPMSIRLSTKAAICSCGGRFKGQATNRRKNRETKLTMPVLTVGGEKANGVLLGEQTKIASDVMVIVLENTGHWVLEERPKETTDALMKFL